MTTTNGTPCPADPSFAQLEAVIRDVYAPITPSSDLFITDLNRRDTSGKRPHTYLSIDINREQAVDCHYARITRDNVSKGAFVIRLDVVKARDMTDVHHAHLAARAVAHTWRDAIVYIDSSKSRSANDYLHYAVASGCLNRDDLTLGDSFYYDLLHRDPCPPPKPLALPKP